MYCLYPLSDPHLNHIPVRYTSLDYCHVGIRHVHLTLHKKLWKLILERSIYILATHSEQRQVEQTGRCWPNTLLCTSITGQDGMDPNLLSDIGDAHHRWLNLYVPEVVQTQKNEFELGITLNEQM